MVMRNFRYKLPTLLLIMLFFCLSLQYASLAAENENLIKIKVVNHSYQIERVGSISYYVVIGEVRNNNTRNVEVWKVESVFYDDKNNFIGSTYGYTALKVLRPKEESPFMIYWYINSSENIPAKVKLTCLAFETDREPDPPLEIQDLANYTDENGYFVVSGKAYNVGPSAAYNVRIYCTYYDSNGSIMGMCRKVVSAEVKVNGYVSFKVSSSPYKIMPSKVKVLAVASYRPKFEARIEIVLILVVVCVAFIYYMKKFRGW